MKKITFMIDSFWILKHRNDDVLPMDQVVNFLRAKYPDSDLEFSDVRYDSLTCKTSTFAKEEIVNSVRSFLKGNYKDFRANFLSDNVEDDTSTEENEDFVDEESEKIIDESDDMSTKSLFDRFRADMASSQTKKDSPENKESHADALSEIAETVEKSVTASGAEFKILAKELRDIAPQINKNDALDVILAQKYLFSIGDGCGLPLYLKLLRDTINAMELKDFELEEKIIIGKIPPEDPKQTTEYYLENFKHTYFEKYVVGVDISDWMQHANSNLFREILQELMRMCYNDIIVFNVPFVEKEVLATISEALNDLMFIRTLSFPPFTMEEIHGLANTELQKFGFTMDESGWENFRRRIIQESSDGRFHGIDTVNKVVHEMLYIKQLKNAVNGVEDSNINAEDTQTLCHDDFAHGQSGMEMLENMVGTESIKQKILEIISQIKLARLNSEMGTPCLHMRFLGNPGTGKTTVARIIGKILKENGILRIGEFHEHSGRDFCGRYIGETAPKTSGICRDAYGSVLFIDEAYSLYRGGDDTKDFGREALDTLIAEMENHRNDLVVIMAGYTDDMDRLMEGNAGLLSRMPYSIEFPNFTREQLFEIFQKMVDGKIGCDEAVMQRAKEYFLGLDEEWIQSKQFSNGRFVRNLFERCCAKAAMRCQLEGTENISVTEDDFERSIGDKDFLVKSKKRRIGFGN